MMSHLSRRVVGNMVDILLLAAVATFLVSAVALLVGGEAEIWLLALLVSGLSSGALLGSHLVMEWLLGWTW